MAHTIHLLGVPMDLGQSLRGVDMGPSAVRYAGLSDDLRRLGHEVDDLGNVAVPVRDHIAEQAGEAYLPAVREVCSNTYDLVCSAVRDGAFPLVLGGDHSISAGTVGGASAERRVGLVWIDAHGDLNTVDTSPSGNVHGMPLAALLGRGASELVDVGRPGAKVRPEDVALVGVRDLDPAEQAFIREQGVNVYSMRQVDERGMGPVVREILSTIEPEALHVSLDLDSLDPQVAPGVGTPVTGGFSYREAHLLLEVLADSGRVKSADAVEVNPILDTQNRTARLTVELLASLLGKSIL
jgi:arginase